MAVVETQKHNEISIWGLSVWNSKWIQIILSKVSNRGYKKLQERIDILLETLKYPWLWDEENISRFIDVFYDMVRIPIWNEKVRQSFVDIWRNFENLRKEQLMEQVNSSTEDEIKRILEPQWIYASAAEKVDGLPVWVFGK